MDFNIWEVPYEEEEINGWKYTTDPELLKWQDEKLQSIADDNAYYLEQYD